MIKAVIFDWGGVIAPDPKGGWPGVLAGMLGATVQDLLPHWHMAGYRDFSRGAIDEAEFLRSFEISSGRALPDDMSRVWMDGSALSPWPEMLVFIQKLKDKQCKVGLLSNTIRPMSTLAFQKGFYEGFEPLILSDAVGYVKPELPIYQQALDGLQLLAEECIYVDDLLKNLEPAKELGMLTILASENPKQTIASIERAMRY